MQRPVVNVLAVFAVLCAAGAAAITTSPFTPIGGGPRATNSSMCSVYDELNCLACCLHFHGIASPDNDLTRLLACYANCPGQSVGPKTS
jgi:hypothetical protein